MTWVGVSASIAAQFGGEEYHAPYIMCDRCNSVVFTKRAQFYYENPEEPTQCIPGWLHMRSVDGRGATFRRDYCPRCRKRMEEK